MAGYIQNLTDSLGSIVAKSVGGVAGVVAGPAMEGTTNALVLIRIGYLAQERCRSLRRWDACARRNALVSALASTQKVAFGLTAEIVRQAGVGLLTVGGAVASGVANLAGSAKSGIATAADAAKTGAVYVADVAKQGFTHAADAAMAGVNYAAEAARHGLNHATEAVQIVATADAKSPSTAWKERVGGWFRKK